MMTVELKRQDLIALLHGVYVPYEMFERLEKYGQYYESSGWNWRASMLVDMTDNELYNLYLSIRNYP